MSASDISKKATCEVTVREVSENANVIAGDFSVMTISDVIGYNVGFELINATAFDIKEIVVKLYKGEEVLATNTSAGILEKYPDETSLSAPFDAVSYTHLDVYKRQNEQLSLKFSHPSSSH